MHRSRSFDLTLTSRILEAENTENKKVQLRGSIGDDLQDLARDRAIVTDPDETRRRRTIRLTRPHLRASWGFTLQTYGIRNKRTREVEVMSYVDYVEINGPAWVAGMKKGDVILSVNGESVDSCTHADLVTKIQRGGRELRLVVLFEDCCKKVELQERYIKLKKLLSLKVKELRQMEGEESRLLRGAVSQHYSATNGSKEILASTPNLLSRLNSLRQSGISQSSIQSSSSSEWDGSTYSEITSSLSLDNVRRTSQYSYEGSISDVSTLSTGSQSSAPDVSISGSSGCGSQSDNEAPNGAPSDVSKTVLDAEEKKNGARPKPKKRTTLTKLHNQEEITEIKKKESDEMLDRCGLENGDVFNQSIVTDWDTDSQTSFFSVADSNSPRVSSLSDIITGEDSSRLKEAEGSEGADNFRQMYTVARWVGVVGHNVPSTGHHQNSLPSAGRLKRLSSSSLEDQREVTRVRSLSSVHEVQEEHECRFSSLTTVCSSGETEQISTDNKLTGSLQNFYFDSDSENSSLGNGNDGTRDRRNTVINNVGINNGKKSVSSSGSDVCSSHSDVSLEESSTNTTKLKSFEDESETTFNASSDASCSLQPEELSPPNTSSKITVIAETIPENSATLKDSTNIYDKESELDIAGTENNAKCSLVPEAPFKTLALDPTEDIITDDVQGCSDNLDIVSEEISENNNLSINMCEDSVFPEPSSDSDTEGCSIGRDAQGSPDQKVNGNAISTLSMLDTESVDEVVINESKAES